MTMILKSLDHDSGVNHDLELTRSTWSMVISNSAYILHFSVLTVLVYFSGRPYHISALYVVDLVKFRRIAAGDRLRGQYQALSQDPNSLSNLDQDLPNNMVHQVPIHSLPQEWLWCETWCGQEGKEAAKNIDLCNNPLTKESKLDAARRIVPEWTDYDDEVTAFVKNGMKKVQQGKGSKEPDHEHTEL